MYPTPTDDYVFASAIALPADDQHLTSEAQGVRLSIDTNSDKSWSRIPEKN
jgi:hypothetical protein